METGACLTIADLQDSLKVCRTTRSVQRPGGMWDRKMGDYFGDASVTYFMRSA